MSDIKLNVLFKKMQKDDKKEVLMFHILSDELPHADELLQMPGTITVLKIEDSETEEFGAEFVSIQRDNKKTVLKFNINRSDDKVNKLYPFAGSNVNLSLKPSQMTIDEFYEEGHEGIAYNVGSDGTVHLDPNQLSFDDEVEPPEEDEFVEEETKLQRVK
ncbi:hypothetical protein PU629_06350 [Pullulanibacillus sp. KACC 23026]|uniref:hypothetical protein n=1 Tax=Pullulanibacillus sp. KACC 23026 TaxID=3028315 RepID=UPI0023AF4659|nr:hypothetical protein [Pullulanibacillus sp. KACC 23026]WEG13985.1 hypothetical protein PU629_06350 [Pullulanibacillus sp. KACC 23026]